MAPKKTKGVKMDFNTFLNDEATGSWADEMDEMPSAPSGEPGAPGGLGGSHLRRNDGGGFGGGREDRGGYGDRGDRGDYGDRPPRQEVPIPTAPPYTAFVGNLSFEVTDSDVEGFFSGLTASSIRLVSGLDGKPKGFGYVEFEKLSDLISALELNGADVNGRAVRVSVAEPPKGREGRADEDMTWARQGPLPPLAGGRSSGGFGGGERRESQYDRPREGGFDDGPRAGFGSKFVPSTDSPRRNGGFGESRGGPPGGMDRGMGGGYERAPGPSFEDRGDRAGFGSKFVATPDRPSYNDRSDRRGSGPTEPERDWSARSGPLPPLARVGGPARTGGFGDRSSPVDGSNAYESTPQPQERRKLQLSPRSAAPSPSTGDESSPATDFADSPSIKSSPFGSAKPVDTVERVEAVAESTPAPAVEATTPVVKKAASNPFGSAKPIDMSAKEKEVEEKVEKAKQENALKVKEEAEKVKAAAAAAAAAVPVWGRATPAAGATSPTAEGAKSNEGRKSYNQSNGNVEGGAKKEYKKAYDSSKKSPAPASASVATSAPAVVKKSPAVVTKPALRKEGFSYSSMANTPSAVPTAVETKSVEAKSGLLTKLEETTI